MDMSKISHRCLLSPCLVRRGTVGGGVGAERVSLKPRTEAKDPFCLSLRVVVP